MEMISKGAILRKVAWKDLVPMRRLDGFAECLHPLPWLIMSLVFAGYGYFIAAIPCTFMFFLTALRLNHEAIHHNLGFDARGHRAVLHGLSLFMLGSNHSVAWNHLRHHRHVGEPGDIEGKAGRMGLIQVLFYGPCFVWETHAEDWRKGGARQRRLMIGDAAANLVLPILAIALLSEALAYHLAMMVGAQCMTAFFAVWITHHGCEEEALVARTQRSKLINFVSYNMFFHLEHHLFPAVPVKRLGKLAERFDQALPQMASKAQRVIPAVRRARLQA